MALPIAAAVARAGTKVGSTVARGGSALARKTARAGAAAGKKGTRSAAKGAGAGARRLGGGARAGVRNGGGRPRAGLPARQGAPAGGRRQGHARGAGAREGSPGGRPNGRSAGALPRLPASTTRGWAYQGLDRAKPASGQAGPPAEPSEQQASAPDLSGGGSGRLARRAHAKRSKRKRRRRRRMILAPLVLSVVALLPVILGGAGSTSEPVSGWGPERYASVEMTGIPFAEVFNSTAILGMDPRLVAAVASVESGFDDDVEACRESPRDQPLGIMRLEPVVVRDLGVDPCDPEAAIRAGAQYLLMLYERLGERWDLALAAYDSSAEAVEANGSEVPRDSESYVASVTSQWNSYQRQFPGEEAEPGESAPGLGPGGLGGGPGEPRGSTERFSERGLTARTQAMLDAFIPVFGRGYGVGCMGERSGPSEHPLGRACDFMMSNPANTHPTPDMLDHGWSFANRLVAEADVYGVYYVIWQEQIWSNERAAEGWRPYTRYPNGNLTEKHYDHIHVSMY